MAQVVVVDDPRDPRLVELAGLTDAQARARTEAEHGCFVAEGLLVLDAVLSAQWGIRSMLVDARKLDRVLDALRTGGAPDDVVVHVADRALLEAVTGFDVHRGVLASVSRRPLPPVADLAADARRLLVVEGVNDHENMGALFRNAAAFGTDAVVLGPRCADPLYRRSVRVSLGHVLSVPWTVASEPVPDLVTGLVHGLGGAPWAVLALTPAGQATLDQATAQPRERVAWLVGAEGPGLSDQALAGATETVRIPMASGIDSLNVATATAVALSRTVR